MSSDPRSPFHSRVLLRQERAGRTCAYEGRVEAYPDRRGPIEVSFPAARAPRLAIASDVQVQLLEACIDFAHDVVAKVIECERSPERTSYLLKPRPRGLEGAEPAFNRREALRVKADARTASTLRLLGPTTPSGQPIQAVLLDLSESGVSLRVPVEHEPQLCGLDRLCFSIHMPGEDEELDLEADVRHRELDGLLVRYGLELVPLPAEEHERRRLRLVRYVREHEHRR